MIKFFLLAAHTVDAHPRIGGSHCSYLEAVVYGTSVLWLCTCLIVTNCLTYHGTLGVQPASELIKLNSQSQHQRTEQEMSVAKIVDLRFFLSFQHDKLLNLR